MGDFILDLRAEASRRQPFSGEALRFHPSLNLEEVDCDGLLLFLTYSNPSELWAPYRAPDGSLFAVAGLCALDDAEWEAAEGEPGTGGLAAKALCLLYRRGGLQALEGISGNGALLVHDAPARRVHLVADPAGAFPVFECETDTGWLFGSHPDVLARAAGEEQHLDEVSLAEFVLASTVTPPFTFYERVRAFEHGTTATVDLDTRILRRHSHFKLEFQVGPGDREQDLAEELADALKAAVRRRTHPRFGTPVVALSGGADSRLLLASMEDPSRALAFTCYDQPNRELEIAGRVAAAFGARFLPLRRGPDYYAENAEEGVRISGGMGTFANNHFLGVLDRLRAEGMGVLLTGCYFDYMFKGLPLNRTTHWLTGRESLAPFSHQFYFSRRLPPGPLAERVQQRWEARIPSGIQGQSCDADVFAIEALRTFPLCYEGDNQQRVVPQRVTNWFPPVADRRVLEVYCRIPSRMKLNHAIFLRAARRILEDSPARNVPNANTGASLFASAPREWISRNALRLQRKLRSRGRTLASDGSWPDWRYYLKHSPRLRELWLHPQPPSGASFRKVLGCDQVPATPDGFPDDQTFLFVSLLTQKLWFHQRQP